MHIMRDHNNRHSTLIELTQKLHDLCIMLEILSCSRLIQDDQFRILHKYTCDRHTLFLTETQCRYRPVSEWIKPADFERIFYFLVNFRLCHSRFLKAQCYLVIDHCLGDHLVWILHDISNVFRTMTDIFFQQIFSVEGNLSGIRVFKSADQLGKC